MITSTVTAIPNAERKTPAQPSAESADKLASNPPRNAHKTHATKTEDQFKYRGRSGKNQVSIKLVASVTTVPIKNPLNAAKNMR